MPEDVTLLIDEFHEFFFETNIQLNGKKIISHINKMFTATKTIGVSATYRGDNGLDKIISILGDISFI